MSQRPAWRVGLRLAAVGVLIAPSVVGALALFIAEPEAGLLVGGPALGVAMALWSARGGWSIAAGVLAFVIAGFGGFMSFAIGLGWADGAPPSESPPYDALGLAVLSFLIAMPASIVLAVIQASRPDDGRDSPAAAAAADDADRPAARVRPGVLTIVGISTVPVTIGAYVGYTSTYPWNSPDGLAELGQYLVRAPVLPLFLALGIAAVVGIAVRARKGMRSPSVGRRAGAAGLLGLLGLGSLGGFFLTPVLGLPCSVPIVAFGSATARFDGLPTFIPYVGGYAECESAAGTAVSRVFAENLGELGSRTLEARISYAAGSADIQLSAGWRVLTGVGWDGPAEVLETSDRGASGRVTFRATILPEAEGDWPAELSGELTWACGNWLGPPASQADQHGRLDLRLDGVDWVPPPSGASATCDIEAGGSVGILSTDGMGLLQGTSGTGLLRVGIDLRAEHAVGSEVVAWIELIRADAPIGQYPGWIARVRIAEVGDDERSGRVAFINMPRIEDSTSAPMPAGWPDALTGEFTWTCG